ncbi:MAG: MFS transporter [Phycicoccus sp.]|nr:MFS transporter [Phycicoccus sp.]
MKQPLQTATRPLNGTPRGRRPSIWRHRDLRLVIPALTISLVGDSLAMIALILRVHDQGGGTSGIALLMVAFALPTVLAMGVAGHIADRFDSRPVLMVSTSVQVLACAGLASFGNRWSTYAFVVLLQWGQAVSSPTWGALTPRIAGDEDMGRVISLQRSLLAASGIAGAALAGLLVGTHGTATALWVDCGTFGAVVLAAGLVRTRRGGRHEASRRCAEPVDVARPHTFDGLRILRRDSLIWLIFCWTIPFIIVLEGVNVVEVFLVRDDLGASPTTYGLLEAFFGTGAVAGSWAAGRLATDDSRVRGVLIGSAGTALSIAFAGLAPTVAVLAVCLVLLGIFNGGANTAIGPLYVLRPAEAERGRVLAAINGVSRAGSILALGLGGLVGGWLGPRVIFVAGGVCALMVVAALAWSLRGLDRTPRLPEEVLAPALGAA